MQKGKVDVLLGLQWGDEGKGKVVDVLTPQYDVVARFQGGPNAGHTLEFEGEKYVLRSIPSGIFQGGKVNIIGNGVVLAPDLFMAEAKDLEKSGHDLKNRLHISKKAHLIMPTHRVLDAAYEAQKGKSKVGTTGKGIGPTYTDKISRNGLRVGDIFENFAEKYAAHKARHEAILKSLNYTDYNITEVEKTWMEGIEYMKQFQIVDSEYEINQLLKSGKSILCEGAQGTMLDVDFGSYPFVTSSNTICAGACTGLGIGPNKVGEVFGIMKAYCTRVGAGPFPTELFDETGAKIRDLGHEYGAVTGRERRCGWIDLVALRYAIDVNGVTQLIMMKSDVLDGFDTIKACVAYKQNGVEIDHFPFSIEEGIEPIYKELPGWKTDMTKFTSEDQFPKEFGEKGECFLKVKDLTIGGVLDHVSFEAYGGQILGLAGLVGAGLAIVAEINISDGYKCVITNQIAEQFNLNMSEVFETARENMESKYPAKMISMQSALFGDGNDNLLTDRGEIDMMNTLMSENSEGFGAVAIIYKGVAERIRDILGDYYILPSSLHELIILRDCGDYKATDLKDMVTYANQTVVDACDILSNSVFYYSEAGLQRVA